MSNNRCVECSHKQRRDTSMICWRDSWLSLEVHSAPCLICRHEYGCSLWLWDHSGGPCYPCHAIIWDAPLHPHPMWSLSPRAARLLPVHYHVDSHHPIWRQRHHWATVYCCACTTFRSMMDSRHDYTAAITLFLTTLTIGRIYYQWH